jgi:hypothetical protein
LAVQKVADPVAKSRWGAHVFEFQFNESVWDVVERADEVKENCMHIVFVTRAFVVGGLCLSQERYKNLDGFAYVAASDKPEVARVNEPMFKNEFGESVGYRKGDEFV